MKNVISRNMKQAMNVAMLPRQQGVALLEVLIVFFVLSIGLLGMAALQLKSIQYSQSSYLRSQATVAANDMLDRLRLNGGVEFASGDAELVEWVEFINATLPTDGTDPEQDCAAGVCTIKIVWVDRFVEGDGDGDGVDDAIKTLVISSGI